MTVARNPGRKIGVLLVNKRLEVPSSYPDWDSLQQITYAPEIQEIAREGDYWRINGLLNVCITYKRDKRVSSANEVIDGELGQLAGFLQEKTFFDDGFSDHDEFAEEGAKLVEDDWEEGNPREDSISYLQPLEFSGLTPLRAGFVPSDTPIVSLIDVENKTPGEHMLDIGAILLFEDEALPQVAEQAWGEGVEFIQPFALTSWPPGMAEVVEWQVGYPEWSVMLKDGEALVSGNLIVQVIGTEKEGEEREFTGISTQCPIRLTIPLDASRSSNSVSGVKVEILEVREDPVGLAVRGQVLIDRIAEVSAEEVETREEDFTQGEMESLEAEISEEPDTIKGDFVGDEAEFQLEGTYSGDMDPDSHDILSHIDMFGDELSDFEDVLCQPLEEEAEVTQFSIGQSDEPSVLTSEDTYQEAPQATGNVKFRLSYSKSPRSPQSNQQEPPSPIPADQLQPVPGILKKIAQGKGRTNWKLYLVKQQDTLESICQNYGISQEDFRAKNKLDTNVEPGQYLWITR